MLKRKIAKEAYDALADALKAEYKPNGDSYVLDTDDATDLINARDLANRERDEAKRKLQETTTELTALKKAGGDFTQLEESYKSKIAALEGDLATANTKLTAADKTIKCGPIADKIAGRFSVPSLVRDKILARLDVDPRTGEPRVLDATGKASASSVDDLTKEFVDNPEFKPIVIASKASGSAGNQPGTTGGSAPNLPQEKQSLAAMTPAQLAEHMKAKRANDA